MKAKLLKTNIAITVKRLKHWWCFPACARPTNIPFEEDQFEADAYALWFIGESIYIAVMRNGRQLIVPTDFVNPDAVHNLLLNAEENFIRTQYDISRYGLAEFAEDLMMLKNHFNVFVTSAKFSANGLVFVADFKWTLDGHCKTVKNMTYNVLLKDEYILCL